MTRPDLTVVRQFLPPLYGLFRFAPVLIQMNDLPTGSLERCPAGSRDGIHPSGHALIALDQQLFGIGVLPLGGQCRSESALTLEAKKRARRRAVANGHVVE